MNAQFVPWVAKRIRHFREEEGLSQRDIERATGMKAAYVSRVENGHTVPSLETLERFAAAFGVPLYQLFLYPSDLKPEESPVTQTVDKKTERFLMLLKECVHGMRSENREFLLDFASKLAAR